MVIRLQLVVELRQKVLMERLVQQAQMEVKNLLWKNPPMMSLKERHANISTFLARVPFPLTALKLSHLLTIKK